MQLNNNLTANSQPFRFGYDSESGKYGYILNQGGADTVIPFSGTPRVVKEMNADEYTVTADVNSCLIIAVTACTNWGDGNHITISTSSGIASSFELSKNNAGWSYGGDSTTIWYADTIVGGKIKATSTSGDTQFCIIAV